MRIQTRALKFGICTDTQRGARIARHCTFPRRRNARVPACILSSYVVSNASRKSPRDFGLYLLFSTSIRVFCGYFLAVLNLVSVCYLLPSVLFYCCSLFFISFVACCPAILAPPCFCAICRRTRAIFRRGFVERTNVVTVGAAPLPVQRGRM